jgi:ABC-type glycerol-3-phosphate transport system permease component
VIARTVPGTAVPRVRRGVFRVTRSQRTTALRGLALALYTIVTVFPFYWMVITTFKQNGDLYSETNNPLWFNAPPTLANLE